MSLKQTDKFWHSSFGGPLMWQFLINKTFCIFVILTDGMFRKIVVSSFRNFFYLENEEFEHVLYFSSFFFPLTNSLIFFRKLIKMTISLFTDLKKKKKRNNDANFQFSLAVCFEGHCGPWGCIKKTLKNKISFNKCLYTTSG